MLIGGDQPRTDLGKVSSTRKDYESSILSKSISFFYDGGERAVAGDGSELMERQEKFIIRMEATILGKYREIRCKRFLSRR